MPNGHEEQEFYARLALREQLVALGDENARLKAEVERLRSGAHASDCAVHNEPAYPNGPCACAAAVGEGEG